MKVKVYKCFIGSPGDTLTERQHCKEVFNEINKTIGEKFSFRIEPLMWEDDSRPSFGDDVQDVINRQLLLKEYHIFIGIMWSRFGTPSTRAESGTLEEFEDAYRKFKEKKDLEICIYFNKKDIPQEDLDIEQFAKVREFKKKVTELGGLFHEYDGPDEFKKNLHSHLMKFFLEKYQNEQGEKETSKIVDRTNEIIKTSLEERLNRSLTMFDGQKPCWIDPVLSKTNLISTNYNENFESRVDLDEIIESPTSIIVKSPPQFGLTCLANFLVLKAWEKNDIWIYLSAEKLDINAVEKEVLNELRMTFHSENPSEIKCIILDSWKNNMHGCMKMLKGLSTSFSEIPIIVMQTINANNFLQEPQTQNIDREFQVLHLLSLPKTEIRKMVSSYNQAIYIGEEDKVVNKIVLDLDTLNIHRTPMNCLTLLKVSEKYFDERTINRTDMLDKVLYILFNLKNLPTYKSTPDVKDCEFVLGIFCEELLKTEKYTFSKKDFISFSTKVCEENYIDLDINSMFDILYYNGIIIDRFSEFIFRASYWLFYFAAHRMHASQDFCDYIFDSEKYINYPELIEFYTGIDRRRTQALEILSQGLSSTCSDVSNKLGLPEHIDPYLSIEWNPSQESIEQIREEINKDVQSSKLPVEIKDQHSDMGRNQLRPYNQAIKKIMHEYSLTILIQKITASGRALRNSDYADPQKKKELLNSIVNGYEQIAKTLMILTPELSIKGRAVFDGHGFRLFGDFGKTINERFNNILTEIPFNVINFFKDDINSDKLGPLIIERINDEKIHLNKHLLVLLIINIRPAGWRKTVEAYIKKLPKNSFYLFDLMKKLRVLYIIPRQI